MNIFVLDKANRTEKLNRDWQKIIPQNFTLLKKHDRWNPNEEDFVIIHRTDFEPTGCIDPALTKKLRTAGCLRLFIAGNSMIPQMSKDGKRYFRGAPVSYPIDLVFRQRLVVFLERLSSLPPDEPPPWGIIEPEALPENMAALYLLLVALERKALDSSSLEKLGEKLGGEFWGNIQTELISRGKTMNLPSSWVAFLDQPGAWVPIKHELTALLIKTDESSHAGD